MIGQHPAFLLFEILLQRPAHALGDSALNLPLHHLGIDGVAHVVGRPEPQHGDVARIQIDFDFGDLRAIPIGDIRVRGAGFRIIG